MAVYPRINFSNVAGNDSFKGHFKDQYSSLDCMEIWQEMKNSEIKSFLLHGPRGCGKTLLAHSIAGEYELALLSEDATYLAGGISKCSKDLHAIIMDLFRKATELAPCILLIENIESITVKGDQAARALDDQIFIQLVKSIHDLRCNRSPVLVICTTSRPDLLDKTYRTLCFGMEHAVRIPNKCARESILQALCIKLNLADDVSLSDIAGLTRGYVGSDLKSLIDFATIDVPHTVLCGRNTVLSEHELQTSFKVVYDITGEGCRRLTDRSLEEIDRRMITNGDFQRALAAEPYHCRKNGILYSHTTWDDLGGLDSIRMALELDLMDFQDEMKRPELYQSLGLRVLLYGPSGCGKKAIAKAIANDAEMNLLYVRGEDLLSEIIGQTEDNVRIIFKRARSLTPCLIFIDELDSLCPKRSSESHEKSVNNATTQLLMECLLLEPGSEIYLMAATISLDELDPELLKACRINKTIHVGLPSPEGRVEILRALTKCHTSNELAYDVDLDCIGKDRRCDGFTGADLERLVHEASFACGRRTFDPETSAPRGISLVNKTDFDIAFESMIDSEDKKTHGETLEEKKKLKIWWYNSCRLDSRTFKIRSRIPCGSCQLH